VRQLCNVMLVEFWHDFWPIVTHWIIHVHSKVASGIRRRKFQFSVFKSGNT
jgi:hypothetical protein